MGSRRPTCAGTGSRSRAWAALVVLALVGPVLAGCVGSGSQQTTGTDPEPVDPPEIATNHTLDRVIDFEAEADDGVMLRGHVYIPDGEGPFPVILVYSPYYNGLLMGETEGQATEDGSSVQGSFGTLLEAGFALALVNLRGTGESDGCNNWLHHEKDGADARAVIETLANASWSNGNVGMVGISWFGYSQYAAIAGDAPSLKAVAPASAVLDLWELFTRRGPPIISQFGPMATTYVVFQTAVAGSPGNAPPNRVQCPKHAEQIQAMNQLSTHGDKTAWFQERTAHDHIDQTDIPMFVTNGLTKLSEGHILQVDGLWPLMPEESRLMLGQWGHSYPTGEKADWYWETLVKWFDHYLRDGPKQVPTGFVQYQDNEGTWYESPTWPPAANRTTVHLSDGTVVDDPDDVQSSMQPFWASDKDPRPTECTGDKALYVSPPLAEDVLLAGNFHTNVTVTSSAPNSNFGVYVWHVEEPYACTDASPHAQPISYPDEVSRALSDLRHRGHLEQGEPFPVGEPAVMAMKSHPFATRVRAGERLVVGITGGSLELSTEDEDPALTIHTGEDVEAWIDLPVVEGELVFEDV